MNKIISEYKRLKSQLTNNVGFEETMDEVIWNEGIFDAIENLLKDVSQDLKTKIILNHE